MRTLAGLFFSVIIWTLIIESDHENMDNNWEDKVERALKVNHDWRKGIMLFQGTREHQRRINEKITRVQDIIDEFVKTFSSQLEPIVKKLNQKEVMSMGR